MINIEQYKPHNEVTKEILRDNNFRYMDGYYSYRFPVLKYKKDTTLWCNIYINLEHKCCGFTVNDTNFNTYPAFFNREYGGTNHQVVEKVEAKIETQLASFVKDKILYKKEKKSKKEGAK
jgi:hypothetical protein